MKRKAQGFTLVELMLVVLIIALLMAILVPAIPSVMSQVKGYKTRILIGGIDRGMEEYRNVYHSYMGVYWWGDTKVFGVPYSNYDTVATDYALPDGQQWQHSLYVALQGPDGFGWKAGPPPSGSQTPYSYGADVEFGPYFDSTSDIAMAGTGVSGVSRPLFVDAFGNQILYQRANQFTAGQGNIYSMPGGSPFTYQYNAVSPTSIGDTTCPTNTQDGVDSVAAQHWTKMLVKSKSKSYYGTVRTKGGHDTWHYRYYNAKSYILWSAGPDGKFGYWFWDTTMDGWNWEVGTGDFWPELVDTDDITNFGPEGE
jgi:prepilin-type N-terminal cleavage/methylation domain-containing protein